MLSLYEQLFMTAPEKLCVLNSQGMVLSVNTSFCALLACEVADVVGKEFTDFVTPSYHTSLKSHLADKQCDNFLLTLRHKGKAINCYWHHQHINNFIYAKCSHEFIFSAHHTNLLENNTSLDHIINKQVLDDGIWDWNLEKGTMYYSPRWKEIMGYTDDELYNDVTTWQNIIHEEDLKTTLQLIKDYNTGQVPTFEVLQRYYHKNNSTVYVYCRATHFKNEAGQVVRMVGVVNDITPIKLAEEKLRKSETILSKAQEIAKMGSWEWNTIDNKIVWSEQLYKLLGYTPNEFEPTDSSFLQVIHPDDRAETMKIVWSYIRNKKAGFIECRVLRKDKQEILIRCEGQIEYNSLKVMTRVIGVVWDITEQKKAQDELVKAKEVAEASVHIKEQFISTMSHEIRTPMNAVIGMTSLLLQENPQPHQTEYLSVLQSAAKNLLLLINDILDFSKIEAGKIVFEQIDFSLPEVVKNIANIYQYNAKEKGIILKTDLDSAIPYLIGDPTKLTQVLTNLVSNAIKFTSKGTVTMIANLVNEKQNEVQVEFSVQDTGIGIPPERINNIFESFTQATAETTRKYGGTGLGLTISQNLVELQGGKLQVQSKVGEGSTFYFTLPYQRSSLTHIPNTMQDSLTALPEDLQGVKVLVAEDNDANRFVISRFFNKWKVSYDFAENGQEAIQKVQQRSYDMIFMDLHMPIIDGYEATKTIRELPAEDDYFKQLPIIALTASVLSAGRFKLETIGINEFLMKPFEPQVLYRIIAKYSQKQQTKFTIIDTPLATQETSNYATETVQRINFANFEKITMGESSFGRELLQLYIKQMADYVQEMNLLVAESKATEIHSLNHKIKSTMMILSLENLYQQQHKLGDFVTEKSGETARQHEIVKQMSLKVKDLLEEKLQTMHE